MIVSFHRGYTWNNMLLILLQPIQYHHRDKNFVKPWCGADTLFLIQKICCPRKFTTDWRISYRCGISLGVLAPPLVQANYNYGRLCTTSLVSPKRPGQKARTFAITSPHYITTETQRLTISFGKTWASARSLPSRRNLTGVSFSPRSPATDLIADCLMFL